MQPLEQRNSLEPGSNPAAYWLATAGPSERETIDPLPFSYSHQPFPTPLLAARARQRRRDPADALRPPLVGSCPTAFVPLPDSGCPCRVNSSQFCIRGALRGAKTA